MLPALSLQFSFCEFAIPELKGLGFVAFSGQHKPLPCFLSIDESQSAFIKGHSQQHGRFGVSMQGLHFRPSPVRIHLS